VEGGRAICVFSAGISVGDGDIRLEMQRGKARAGREKSEPKMVTPGDQVLRAEGSIGQGREGVKRLLK